MKRKLEGAAILAAGVVAGIALVISCDGIGGAGAQDMSGGACSGTCTVAGPIDVTGQVTVAGQPVKILTADTDATRLRSGSTADTGSFVPIAQGPLVLSDLVALSNTRVQVYLLQGAACPPTSIPAGAQYVASLASIDAQLHGGRILVPAGSIACTLYSVLWSGFVPY